MRILLTAVLVLGVAAQLLFMPAAKADPDTCRVAPDGQWYSQTGQRCRSTDIQQWPVQNSPELHCWWLPLDPMCRESGAGPGAR